MRSKFYLKFLVIILVVSILIIWGYLNRNMFADFTWGEDLTELKDKIGDDVNELGETGLIDRIKNIIKSRKEEPVDVNGEVIEKILNKLPAEQNFIEYDYQPWQIKFNYDEAMAKEIKDNQIILTYQDSPWISVIIQREYLGTNEFNDWLNDNFDLQKLDKIEQGDLIYWLNDLSTNELNEKNYYLNSENYIYSFLIKCPQEQSDLCEKNINIVESFNIY